MKTSDEATTAETTTSATESTADGTATDAAATTDAQAADAAEGESTEGADGLGDAGKKALDRMKAERDAAIAAAKEAKGDPNAAARIKAEREELKAARAELAAMQAKSEGREAEFKAEQEAQKVRDDALAGANERILKADIRTAAKGKLNDPNDAFRYPEDIDLSSFEADEDGEFDTAAIAQAIDSLIERKPYLAAQGGKRFQGSADGGARNGGNQPAQLSESDVKRLYAEGNTAEIEKARQDGRLSQLLGG